MPTYGKKHNDDKKVNDMNETPENSTKTDAGEKNLQYNKRRLIDIGKLVESTGRGFYSHPNVFCGQDDLFKTQMMHKLILSRIFTSRI